MFNQIIASVYDTKAKAYMRPFFERNTATALRAFAQAVNEKGSQFNLNAEDFVLLHLADWNEQDGQIRLLEVPVSIASALSLLDNEA